MKKKITLLVLGVIFSVGIYYYITTDNKTNCQTMDNRRGCCSHHGGVCSCEKGRAKCCDGSLSPSCGCD